MQLADCVSTSILNRGWKNTSEKRPYYSVHFHTRPQGFIILLVLLGPYNHLKASLRMGWSCEHGEEPHSCGVRSISNPTGVCEGPHVENRDLIPAALNHLNASCGWEEEVLHYSSATPEKASFIQQVHNPAGFPPAP